jgi:outer membrane protein assembly factor BamB
VTPGPVVGPDGTIYAASNAGVLHALNPTTGSDRWSYDSGQAGGGDLSVSPLILPDGTVLWPTPGREVVAVSSMGQVMWSQKTAGHPTSPASLDGRRVYVGDTSGVVTAIAIAGQTIKCGRVQLDGPGVGRSTPPTGQGPNAEVAVTTKQTIESPASKHIRRRWPT